MTLINNFDLIIIGAGPGGYEAAIHAAKGNLRVALIEKNEVGGTCLNHGCIPTKALYKNAEIIHQLNDAKEFGIDINYYVIHYQEIQNRKNKVIEQLKTGIQSLLKHENITLYKGNATMKDEFTVLIENESIQQEITGSHILIATGSKSNIPNIEGIQLPNVLTSTEVLELEEIPKRMVIIGAGVIGVEIASIFNALGTEIEMIEYQKNIVPNFDVEVAKRLKVMLKNKGITIHNEFGVERITEENGLTVYAKNSKGKELNVQGDIVLVSVGRIPNVDGLDLERANIEYTRKGIIVNDRFQTNQSNIYAIGDCIGGMMLAHTATYQGFKVVDQLLGRENTTDFEITPACVFTFPEVASVGLTEEQASLLGEIHTNKYLFRANGKALSLGETDGFVKVITNASNELIGVHIIGPHASDLIASATLALNKKMTVHELTQIIFAHPTLVETFSEAVRGLEEL